MAGKPRHVTVAVDLAHSNELGVLGIAVLEIPSGVGGELPVDSLAGSRIPRQEGMGVGKRELERRPNRVTRPDARSARTPLPGNSQQS